MIKLIGHGTYNLVELRDGVKFFQLINEAGKTFSYTWLNTADIGAIVLAVHNPGNTGASLAAGKYRLYNVKEEEGLLNARHLELHAGDGVWQGYVLPKGLPTKTINRKKIIPTQELITRVMR